MSDDNVLTMFVRVAGYDDLAAIVDLLQKVHAELAAERGAEVFYASEARPEPFGVGIAADIAADGVHVAVGGIDGVVLGMAVSRLRTSHGGDLVSRVEELVVDVEARGVGLGVSLLDDATRWAQTVGASGIESYALPGQRATKNFFEAAGMKARLLTVHRSFEAPRNPEVEGEVAPTPNDGQ